MENDSETSKRSLLWSEELWRLVRNLPPTQRVEFINAVLNFYFHGKEPHLQGLVAYAFEVARESITANEKASELQEHIRRIILNVKHGEAISDAETLELETQKKLACNEARCELKKASKRDQLRSEIASEIEEVERLFRENPALANEWGWKPPEDR